MTSGEQSAGRPRAVVVDDDSEIRSLLRDILRDAGFDVAEAATGAEGVRLVTQHRPDLVTLDVGLPDMDGFEALRRLREVTNCYILMLTARDEEIDLVTGLQAGADEYLTKPFRTRELRVRITAMMRRPRTWSPDGAAAGASGAPGGRPTTPAPSPAAAAAAAAAGVLGTELGAELGAGPGPGSLGLRGLLLDPSARTVTVDGAYVELTRREFDTLHVLLSARGAVVTKAGIARALRHEPPGTESYVSTADEHAVEVHLTNLRRKIGESRTEPRWIETVRGVGYRISRPAPQVPPARQQPHRFAPGVPRR